jgi:hypothetical protein
MGSKLEHSRQELEEYAAVLGLTPSEAEITNLLKRSDPISALDEQFKIPNPEYIAFDECLLIAADVQLEGSTTQDGHVAFFMPFEGDCGALRVGAECSLKHAQGSVRIVVLSANPEAAMIARAPAQVERRSHSRHAAGGFAVVRIGERQQRVDLRDISEGGAGVSCPLLIETGKHIDLLLRIEGKDSMVYECEGLVVNCRQPTPDLRMDCWLGVQFTRIPEEMRDAIRRLKDTGGDTT